MKLKGNVNFKKRFEMNFQIKKISPIKYSEIEIIKREIKIVNNLQNAYSRLIAEKKDYLTIFFTTTFGDKNNDVQKNVTDINDEEEIKNLILNNQCQALHHFLKKLRKTKRLKHKVYYFETKELQSNGKLHLHASINIHQDDLISFIEFVYEYKRKKHKNIIPIDRTYISLSNAYKTIIEKEFRLFSVKDKKNPEKEIYWIPYIESREFTSGEATFFEFVTLNDLKERYNENITNYITKTILAQYDLQTIKTGVIKNLNIHNIKNLIKSSEDKNFREQVRTIRNYCRKVYTTTQFPVSFYLYQRNYTKLLKVNKKFKSFYNVIKSFERGYLTIKSDRFFYLGKEVK